MPFSISSTIHYYFHFPIHLSPYYSFNHSLSYTTIPIIITYFSFCFLHFTSTDWTGICKCSLYQQNGLRRKPKCSSQRTPSHFLSTTLWTSQPCRPWTRILCMGLVCAVFYGTLFLFPVLCVNWFIPLVQSDEWRLYFYLFVCRHSGRNARCANDCKWILLLAKIPIHGQHPLPFSSIFWFVVNVWWYRVVLKKWCRYLRKWITIFQL